MLQDAILNDYVVVDVETTGLTSADKIIEFGAVKVIDGKPTEFFAQLANPGMHIPEIATAVNGITDEMVADAPNVDQVLPEFLAFCGASPIVGHNVGFDLGMIRRACEDASISMPLARGADTLHLARVCYPRMESHSLFDLCDAFVTDAIVPSHRALRDVYATQALYEVLKKAPASDENYWMIRRQARRQGPSVDSVIAYAKERGVSLNGIYCVVTGKCELFTRPEMEEIITGIGGVVRNKVTKKTRLLITEEGFVSGKAKEAAERVASGVPISIMTMEDFLIFIKATAPEEEE